MTKYTDFVNTYNQIVYAHTVLESNYAALEEKVQELEAKAAEAAAFVPLAEPVREAVAEPVAAPVEEEVVEAPVQRVVVDTSTASGRAREIMDEAAAEAAEHVTRALSRVAKIEAEAEAEAENLVRESELAAATIREKAVTEANKAIELKNATLEQRDAIFARLELFYSSQLEEIRSTSDSVGYSPMLNANEISSHVAATEPEEVAVVQETTPEVNTDVEPENTVSNDEVNEFRAYEFTPVESVETEETLAPTFAPEHESADLPDEEVATSYSESSDVRDDDTDYGYRS